MKATSDKVKQMFEKFLEQKREEDKKMCEGIDIDWEDSFADVKYYTDKVMDYEHNDDESKGWTGTLPYLKEKTKEHNHILLLVTFDGAGYDYFTYDSPIDYTEKFQKMLKEAGYDVVIEHCTNYAFEVCLD